jgi:lipoprotein-releasing system ATP-binding protein
MDEPKNKNQVPQNLLVVTDIHKSFPTPAGTPLEVLRGVSLAVAPGEMVAITGASGAGKSTLLHVIGGLEPSDAGTVKLNELDITNASGTLMSNSYKRDIGFIFQFHHLLSDLSASENVALPLFINRENRREAMQRANVALDELNLGTHARHPISHLSGGEQQRVAVARALVTKPVLVLADEPTGNLDAAIGDEIGSLLTAYCRSRPAAIVIATHNEQLARACDRVVHLSEGKLKEILP